MASEFIPSVLVCPPFYSLYFNSSADQEIISGHHGPPGSSNKLHLSFNLAFCLDSHINDEDIVHYALEGLPDKYNLVCGYMGYKDTFLDLKMARFLLITEEIRLKSKSFELTVDSSSASPMILMAESAPYVAVPTVQQATPSPTGPIQQSAPTTGSSGQATTLPNAFYKAKRLSPLPKSYCDAFNDVNWQNPMRDEYHAPVKNNTWTLVPRPTDLNIVRCMWLFHHKYHADGTPSRYKAWLVANGSTQLEGVDVDETFSPVVKPGTIQTVLSLAAS
ncbi:ribonuclease H-like domain-containing protein [Tanacetum coccineum]